MTADVEVYVSMGAGDVLVGRLYSHRRRGSESASFVYADRYLGRADAYALDPELPLSTGTHQVGGGRAMFGAFADSAPDRWGRMLITRIERRRARAAGEGPAFDR